MFQYEGRNRLGIALDVAQNDLDLMPQYKVDDDGVINVQLIDLNGEVKCVLNETGEIQGVNTPFSSYITHNKNLTYELFELNDIPYPDTFYLHFDGDIDRLSAQMYVAIQFALDVGFPLVVKPNNESFSRGVTLVKDRDELVNSVLDLLRDYSEILIQKFIDSREFRVLIFNGEVVFAYERVGDSPIRICHEGAKFKQITNISDYHREIFQKACRVLDLTYGGFDIRSDDLADEDTSNTFILEANSHPTIDTISERKGPGFIRDLYRRLLLFALSKRDSGN